MSERVSTQSVRAAGASDAGVVRDKNEDSFVIADLTSGDSADGSAAVEYPVGANGVLLAVSDGMGGAAAGEVASALVVESIRDSLDESGLGDHIEQAIKEAVEHANRTVWDASQQPGHEGMGATLTAVLVHGLTAHVVQVGDSRAYLVRSGRIRQVTKDQSYVAVLVEAGVLTPDQAAESPYNSMILQAMGTRATVRVALGRLELRRGDLFVVCSDGLWGKLGDEEILAALAEEPSLDKACRRMIDLARERGGDDNITVAVAEVRGDALKEAVESEGVTRPLGAADVPDPVSEK